MQEKTEIIQVRVTPAEKVTFESVAELNGISISAWVRERLRRDARLELQSAGIKVPFMADINFEGMNE